MVQDTASAQKATTLAPDDARPYLVGFNHVRGIGPVRLQALLEAFGTPAAAWNAGTHDLLRAGLNRKVVENLVETRRRMDLQRTWEDLTARGFHILTWDDPAYPRRLKEIPQPPPVLYLHGSFLAQDDWSVAVVGTRRVTAYGKRACQEISAALARGGVTVVSGLARGVDAVAHQAALEEGGRTLAILGSGIDRIYPPEHRRLAEGICAQGGLMSDYPPGTEPEASNFPPRNRIISGLSMAVVVVEAGETSGALITARFAAEQGRDVYAVPGSMYAASSRGTNRLISDGAYPLLNVEEFLAALQVNQVPGFQAARTSLPDSPVEVQIMAMLENEPVHVDEIRTRCGLPIDEVSAALTMLELKGMVQQTGGAHYVIREGG